jgi:hypothetical protein
MKPGYQRLKKRMDEGEFDANEFIEDTRAIAAESPEMADIFARMIEAELKAIQQTKKTELSETK